MLSCMIMSGSNKIVEKAIKKVRRDRRRVEKRTVAGQLSNVQS